MTDRLGQEQEDQTLVLLLEVLLELSSASLHSERLGITSSRSDGRLLGRDPRRLIRSTPFNIIIFFDEI